MVLLKSFFTSMSHFPLFIDRTKRSGKWKSVDRLYLKSEKGSREQRYIKLSQGGN